MTIITLSKAVEFPTGALRALLSTHAPRYRWQCGDDDMRGEREVVPFTLEQLILGVGSPDIIMVTARQKMQPAAATLVSHPHRFHIEISRPTTEDADQALLIDILITAGLMFDQDEAALVQFKPDGNWLTVRDMELVVDAIRSGKSPSIIDRLGATTQNSSDPIAAASFTAPNEQAKSPSYAMADTGPLSATSPTDYSHAAPLHLAPAARPTVSAQSGMMHLHRDRALSAPPAYADEGVFLDRLPTLVTMLNQPLNMNWALLEQGLHQIDPDGEWTILCDPNGHGIISSRTGGIKLDFVDSPMRGRIVPDAIERSYWFKGTREDLDTHSCQLTLTASINTRSVPYDEVEKTARIMSLVVATICREPEAVAVYNAGAATISEALDVAEMINILADNELPIQLWTHINWRSLEFEAVSCFSSGFAPFLGYEIEVWDAPVSAKFVQVKMSDIMRYLLRRGPIIQSGDAFGVREDDRNIRCRFSDSKVDRKRPVFAMNIDFERGSELAASRPERLSERRGTPIVAMTPGPAKRASFGRKGL